mmetsp:Transcript_28418/g.79443  ORF Transcript_28418/g.79443 Transcript_28418/m.79443 type:complete len:126 (+) Transcript_28418:138-515(+)
MAHIEPDFEGKSNNVVKVQELSRDAFEKVADYVQAELSAQSVEYRLLEEMNRATAEKYAGMADKAGTLGTEMETIQAKYEEMKPYLAKIDEIDRTIDELQTTLEALDAYTERLDTRLQEAAAEIM